MLTQLQSIKRNSSLSRQRCQDSPTFSSLQDSKEELFDLTPNGNNVVVGGDKKLETPSNSLTRGSNGTFLI